MTLIKTRTRLAIPADGIPGHACAAKPARCLCLCHVEADPHFWLESVYKLSKQFVRLEKELSLRKPQVSTTMLLK